MTSSFSQFSPPNVFKSRLVMFKLNFRARTSFGSPLNAFCNRLWCSSVSSGNSVSPVVSISGKIKSFNCKQLSTLRLNSSTLMSLFSSSLLREHCRIASISCWRLSTYDVWFCTLKLIMHNTNSKDKNVSKIVKAKVIPTQIRNSTSHNRVTTGRFPY